MPFLGRFSIRSFREECGEACTCFNLQTLQPQNSDLPVFRLTRLAELRCKGTTLFSSLQTFDCYTFCYTLLWYTDYQWLRHRNNHEIHGSHEKSLFPLQNYPKQSKYIIVFIFIHLRTLCAGQSSSPRGPRSQRLITLGEKKEGVF